MKTKLVAILDASGSMRGRLDAYLEGLNGFVATQRDDNDSDLLTLIQFSGSTADAGLDKTVRKVLNNVPLKDVKTLTREDYIAHGSTPLYDAIGSTIDIVGVELAAMPEGARPDKVIFAILTDGEENSSNMYSAETVQDKIKHQKEKYGWSFIYLAATEDGFEQGQRMGAQTVSYNSATDKGATMSYDTMSREVLTAKRAG